MSLIWEIIFRRTLAKKWRCLGNLRLEAMGNLPDDNHMRSIMLTYPGFQTLPRGLKRMLVTSESGFFSDVQPSATHCRLDKPARQQAALLQAMASRHERAAEIQRTWQN
jgi:hypothetical protein